MPEYHWFHARIAADYNVLCLAPMGAAYQTAACLKCQAPVLLCLFLHAVFNAVKNHQLLSLSLLLLSMPL